MRCLENGRWRVSAEIPDNPESKSRNKFTFAGGIDALTTGLGVVIEICSIATEVATECVAHISGRLTYSQQ